MWMLILILHWLDMIGNFSRSKVGVACLQNWYELLHIYLLEYWHI